MYIGPVSPKIASKQISVDGIFRKTDSKIAPNLSASTRFGHTTASRWKGIHGFNRIPFNSLMNWFLSKALVSAHLAIFLSIRPYARELDRKLIHRRSFSIIDYSKGIRLSFGCYAVRLYWAEFCRIMFLLIYSCLLVRLCLMYIQLHVKLAKWQFVGRTAPFELSTLIFTINAQSDSKLRIDINPSASLVYTLA